MGRSVNYPSEAIVVTFSTCEDPECSRCDGTGRYIDEHVDEECDTCEGRGKVSFNSDDFDELIDEFQGMLGRMFPSVEPADAWLGRENHVLAENKLAFFGMSEYCGLVAYWIVPKEYSGPKGQLYYSSDSFIEPLSTRWIESIADKFVAAFGELSKVGSMSNGEGVYRRIDK